MSDSIVKARNVLCILHDEPLVIQELCQAEFPDFVYDDEYSGDGPNPAMGKAFSYSDNTVKPSLEDSDHELIEGHLNVVYVLSPPLELDKSLSLAKRAVALAMRSFELGARAVKCESSGLTHGRKQWQELAEDLVDPGQFWTWVRRPLDDDGVIYSCGMHLLGFPDIEIVGDSVSTALNLIDMFALYLLVDKPGERLQSGGTFSLSLDDPKYRISKTDCQRYEDDEFFFNPNGYWRLEKV